jgi:hypothetical protein
VADLAQVPTTSQPEHTPPGRTRWQRLRGPLAVLAGLAAATLLIRVVDPHEPGHYPVCPTKLLTGIDCPGCGGLRATNDLAHGDVVGAFDHNALFVIAVPIVLFFLGRALLDAWTGRERPQMSAARARFWVLSATALVIVFTVVRNLPFAAYLGSG